MILLTFFTNQNVKYYLLDVSLIHSIWLNIGRMTELNKVKVNI